GFPLGVAVTAVVGAGLQALAAPAYYHVGDGYDLWTRRVDTIGEALALVPAGIVRLAVRVPLIEGAAALWARLARGVLSAGAPDPAGATARAVAEPPRRAPRPGPGAIRALWIHLAAYLGL